MTCSRRAAAISPASSAAIPSFPFRYLSPLSLNPVLATHFLAPIHKASSVHPHGSYRTPHRARRIDLARRRAPPPYALETASPPAKSPPMSLSLPFDGDILCSQKCAVPPSAS